ncbi:MAG: NAD(+) kinase [Synechococcaceae cyanobacterium SM2_3_1]|nr:NAD(+) kinase [Synechococcaceae cyanobacterium SM2_3_1]
MDLNLVVIAYKEGNLASKKACQTCAQQLRERGITVLTAPTGVYHNPYPVFLEATSDPIDLAVVLGGDGSTLAAARYLSPHGIPILSIKSGGHLGFLSQSEKVLRDEDPWERLLQDDFEVRERMMLQAQIHEQVQIGQGDPVSVRRGQRQPNPISDLFFAFNEFCIKPTSQTRLISALMEIEVNDQMLDQYHGDGVLVATPTGTTSYTVAANGPIIHPDLEVITITPICPLSLSSRPIVIGGGCKVEVWPLSDPEGLTRLWADGTMSQSINPGQWVEIRRAPERVKLLILERDQSYYRTLREKLEWTGSRIHIPTTNHHPDPLQN